MIDQTKLSEIEAAPLSKGAHSGFDEGVCVMEAVAYVAGEKWTDSPQCACPIISAFLRNWNDALDDEMRQKLKPYVLRLVGTKPTPEIESRRAWMATDWLVRVYTPAWLRLAKLDKQADLLESLRELTGADDCQPIMLALKAIRNDAWDAAKAAARDALKPTVKQIQETVFVLIDRMIDATEKQP